MAPRITLPGRGAIDLDVELARILNVGLPREDDTFDQMTIDGMAVPRSYVDSGDITGWNATTDYTAQQYVVYDGRLWFANVDIAMGGTAPDLNSNWAELDRQDFFLVIATDSGNVQADDHTHTVTLAGGTGIDTAATDDTVTINLSAALQELSNVFDTVPAASEDGYVLTWDNANSRWQAMESPSGSGYRFVSDGTTDIEVSGTRQTIEFASTTPALTVVIDSDTDSANVTFAIADATTAQSGLLSALDKALLDDVRDGGYLNSDIRINTVGTALHLTQGSTDIANTELDGVLSISNLSDVLSTIAPSTDQVLQWDGSQWDAVTLQPGDYEFPTAAGSDAVRLEPGDYFIQNRIRYRYTGITNSGVATRSVAAEAVIPQNILNSTEFERVGLQTAYHTFPINLDTFLYRGDIVVHENIPYLFLGISTAGDGTVSSADSLRVPANTTISTDVLAANFLTLDTNDNTTYELETSQTLATDPVTVTLNASEGMDTAFDIAGTGSVTLSRDDTGNVTVNGRESRAYTIDTSDPSATATIYRGDVLIQDNVPYMWLGVEGPRTNLVPLESKVIQLGTRLNDPALSEHYLTLNSDIATEHFPVYNSGVLYELGDIIIYEFPMGSIQAADATASPPIPPAPPVDAFLQVQFAGGSGAVPVGGRLAQEPIREGQTGINAVSRDWKIPANSISVFHPWLQYSVNSIVDYEGALYRSLQDVLRTSDGTPLEPPSAAGTADWTLLDVTDAAVINNTGIPELNGVSRQLWDRFNRVAIGYPIDSSMPTGVDNTAHPVFVGEGANAETVRALIDAAEVTEPIRIWAADTTYTAGDQVLHDGGSNVNSIYIAISDHTSAADNPPSENQAQWHLVRSGLVSVRGPDDTGPAGITGNSTLRFNEGSGINVTRDGTTFTITARGSGHSDAEDFGPGYSYNFASVRGGFDSGRVLATQATIAVDNITGTGDDTITLNAGSSRTFEPSTYYGIRLNGDDLRAILPNYPDVENADIIMYGISDPFGNDDITVLQLDPAVASGNTIISYAGLPGTGAGRNPNRTLTFLQLEPTHDTQHQPSIWAREQADGTDTPDLIPEAKLGQLSTAPEPTTSRIDRGWLPQETVYTDTTTVVRTATGQSDNMERFSVDTNTNTATLHLTPHVSEINTLTDVNFDQTATGQQAIAWNGTEWITEDITSSRFTFSDTTSPTATNVEVTGFFTDDDIANERTTPTTVRSADFLGTGGRLQFELARFNSQLRRTPSEFSFSASPAWDQPWSAVTSGNAALVFVQSEDPLFPETHLETLSTSTANVTIGGNPRSRGESNAWSLTYTDATMVHPNSATAAGGSTGEIEVTATSNQGGFTDTISSGSITWNSASLSPGGRIFTNQPRTFLETYPNYTWSMSTNNIISTNSAVITSFNFNNGVTSATGNGINISDVRSGTDELAIGGVGTVTFTTTVPVYNNQSLAGDSIALEFRRPEAVTGTAYTVPAQTYNTSGFPSFSYPIFSFVSDSSTNIPDFVGSGTQHQTTDTRKTRAIGTLNIELNNTTGGTRYIWVAYPTGSPDVRRINVRTRRGLADDTNTLTLDPIQFSSSDLTFINPDAGVPQSAAEGYKWFWIEVPDGDRVNLLQTNP